MQLILEEDDQRAENTGTCICCVAVSSITAGTLALYQCFTWLVVPERLFWLWLDLSSDRYLVSVLPCFVLPFYCYTPIKHLLFSSKLLSKPLSKPATESRLCRSAGCQIMAGFGKRSDMDLIMRDQVHPQGWGESFVCKKQLAKFSASFLLSPDVCVLPTQPKWTMSCGKHSSAALAELPERDAELGFIELRITQGYTAI